MQRSHPPATTRYRKIEISHTSLKQVYMNVNVEGQPSSWCMRGWEEASLLISSNKYRLKVSANSRFGQNQRIKKFGAINQIK